MNLHSKKTTGVHGNTGKAGKKKRRSPNPEGLLEELKRITSIKKMLAAMMYKHEIKDVLKQLHGIQWRQAESLITRARTELALEAGKSVEEHRVDAYTFYVAAMRDPSVPIQTKIVIRERIDRLFGLETHRIIHQGSRDEPIQLECNVDPLSLIERARLLAKEAEEKRAIQQREAKVIEATPTRTAELSGEGTGQPEASGAQAPEAGTQGDQQSVGQGDREAGSGEQSQEG